MKTSFFILVSLGTFFAFVNASLFPDLLELKYQYDSLLRVGVLGEDLNTSELVMKSELLLRSYKNITFVSIQNITYDNRLGNVSLTPEIIDLPIESLKKEFAIYYDQDGKTVEVLVDKTDELWSVNIKKGIASLFQLDVFEIVSNAISAYTFMGYENSIHGKCPAMNVVSRGKDDIIVDKFIDSSNCKGQKWATDSEITRENDRIQPLSVLSKRNYILKPRNEAFIVESIASENIISSSPITGGKNIQTVFIKQSFVRIHTETLNEASVPNTDAFVNEKLFVNFLTDKDHIYDNTGGRIDFDADRIIDKLKTSIEKFAEQTKLYNIKIGKSIDNQPDHVYSILKKMEFLDETQLNRTYTSLSKSGQECFNELLPFVGTYSSSMVIKNLIVNQLTDFQTAQIMVSEFPFHLKDPNSKLILEFLELIKPESNVPDRMANHLLIATSNILSSFIEKTEDPKDQETHVNFYIDKFKASDFRKRLVYIAAMKNIQSSLVTNFLETVIKGEIENVTSYVRSMAIWALRDNPNIINRLYYPIISNFTEDLEVRCMALKSYMHEPTVTKLLKISSLMKNENDNNFFTTYLSMLYSISSSKVASLKDVTAYAKKLFKITRKVKGLINSFQIAFDYFDEKSGNTHKMSITVVGNLFDHGYVTLIVEPIIDIVGINDGNSRESLYIRLVQKQQRFTKSPKLIKSYLNQFFGVLFTDAGSLDVIVMRNGQVTDLFEDFSLYGVLNNDVYKVLRTFVHVDNKEVLVPTDFGTPMVYYMQRHTRTMIDSFIAAQSAIHGSGVKFDVASLFRMNYGMKFFNPFANIWHGIKRNHVMNMELLLNYFLKSSVGDVTTISVQNTNSGIIKNTGFESYVYSDIFVEDYTDDWETKCANCQRSLDLFNAKNYHDEFTIWKNRCDMSGMTLKLMLFNCENKVTQVDVAELRNQIIRNKDGTYATIMSIHQLFINAFALPNYDRCGIRFLAEPDHANAEMVLSNTLKELNMDYEMFNMDGKNKSWGIGFNTNFFAMNSENSTILFRDNMHAKETKTLITSDVNSVDFNVFANYTISSDNLNDPTNIRIAMKASLSNEQQNGNDTEGIKYVSCIERKDKFYCARKATNYRDYSVDISFAKMSKYNRILWKRLKSLFRMIYSDYFVYSEEASTVGSDDMKITVNLPISSEIVNVHVMTEYENLYYKDIPLDSFLFNHIFKPISSHHTIQNIFLDTTKEPFSCRVKRTSYIDNEEVRTHHLLSDTWENIGESCEKELEKDEVCDYRVLTKNTPQNRMVIRVELPTGILETTHPDESTIVVSWNNNTLKLENGYYSNDSFKLKLLTPPRLFMYIQNTTTNVEYNEGVVKLYTLDRNIPAGLCSKHD